MESAYPQISKVKTYIENHWLPHLKGKIIWDLGCGNGEYSAALADLDARQVISSDLQKTKKKFHEVTAGRSNINYYNDSITNVTNTFKATNPDKKIDVVFMNLMTEHVWSPRDFFSELATCLEPDTEIFINHDNYFNPMGHHDHKMLNLNQTTWIVESQAPDCWNRKERCGASETYRKSIDNWSEKSDLTRNPANCQQCNFFRRSQPWAHLLYGEELSKVFPETFFQNELNRISVSQLLWVLLERGFDIIKYERSWVHNRIPPNLEARFGRYELGTFNCLVRARVRPK